MLDFNVGVAVAIKSIEEIMCQAYTNLGHEILHNGVHLLPLLLLVGGDFLPLGGWVVAAPRCSPTVATSIASPVTPSKAPAVAFVILSGPEISFVLWNTDNCRGNIP